MTSAYPKAPEAAGDRTERLHAIITRNGRKFLHCGGHAMMPVGTGFELKGPIIHAYFDEKFQTVRVSAPSRFVREVNEGKVLTAQDKQTAVESTWADIADQDEARQYAEIHLDQFIAGAEEESAKRMGSGDVEIDRSIQATRKSLFSGKISMEEMNAELERRVSAILDSVLEVKQIHWFDKRRIAEVKEFIMRTAKQRGWNDEKMEKAADEILEVLNFSGDLRLSGKSNRVYRMLEKAVLDIF